MSPEEEIIRAENLRELLKQQWEHYRHIETERHWFLSVYAVAIGSILTLALRNDTGMSSSNQIWIISFLIVLSIIGFLINSRWAQALVHFQIHIEETSSMLGITANFGIPAEGIWRVFRTKHLFPSFYAIVIVGLIALLITKLIQ